MTKETKRQTMVDKTQKTKEWTQVFRKGGQWPKEKGKNGQNICILSDDINVFFLHELFLRKASISRPFLACFAASANIFYYYRQYPCTVVIVQCQMILMSRYRYSLNRFKGCLRTRPHLYCYTFLIVISAYIGYQKRFIRFMTK